MPAQDYPVTNPYREGTHNGLDRAMPTGTPIAIKGTVVGLSGNTGLSTGPHLHTQAGRDFYAQNPIDPTPHEFKPGQVVQTGTASQWGNYIIIKTGDVFVVYAHLSKILVTVGQQIEEEIVLTEKDIDVMRIAHTEETGWDFESVHKGVHDPVIKASWIGKDARELVRQQWSNGSAFRTKRIAALKYFGTKPANDAAIKKANETVKAQAKEIESLKAQTGDNSKWTTLKALIRELIGG